MRWADWAEFRPDRPPVGKRESDVAPAAVECRRAIREPRMDRTDPRDHENSRFRRTGTSTWRSEGVGDGVHPICSSSSSPINAVSSSWTSAFSPLRSWLMCSIGEATTTTTTDSGSRSFLRKVFFSSPAKPLPLPSVHPRPLSGHLRHHIYCSIILTMNGRARGRAVVSTDDRAQSGDHHAHTDQPVSLGVRPSNAPRVSSERTLTKQSCFTCSLVDHDHGGLLQGRGRSGR